MIEIRTSSTSEGEINQDLRAFVLKLFETMLLNFGKKFTDLWASVRPEDMELHWCKGLSGYTRREVNRGLAAMDTLAWPPTLPEFKKLCRPPIDPVNAYYEALEGHRRRDNGEVGDWSHPAVFWASRCLKFDLNTIPFSMIKVRWEKALKDELEKGQWDPIPVPSLSISYQKTPIAKDKIDSIIQNLYGILQEKTTDNIEK